MPLTWRRRYGAYIRRGDSVGGSGWRSAGALHPGGTLRVSSMRSPSRASWPCRSTRPGCEQRSVPAGSMGESSCCIADELVLVPPGGAGSGERSWPSWPCRSTRPGCDQPGTPAGSMNECSCCTADELVLVLPGIAPAVVGVARVRYTRSPFDLQLPQLDIQIPHLVVFKGAVEGAVAEVIDVAQVECVEPIGPGVVVHVAAVVEEGGGVFNRPVHGAAGGVAQGRGAEQGQDQVGAFGYAVEAQGLAEVLGLLRQPEGLGHVEDAQHAYGGVQQQARRGPAALLHLALGQAVGQVGHICQIGKNVGYPRAHELGCHLHIGVDCRQVYIPIELPVEPVHASVEAFDGIMDLQRPEAGMLELVVVALGVDGQLRQRVPVFGDLIQRQGSGTRQQHTNHRHALEHLADHGCSPSMKARICFITSRYWRLPPCPPWGQRKARSPKVSAMK